ncbi:adenylate/guanylate cyclase domain-containing protein [Oligoflexus tunisiensis]|uniref:adenylate/guanylate cyclase domain-containing protein n=1 Tax=Oligoflexus tunisiensis TaxID=708132 RepID=UPI00114D1E17|nr:adenylate/guanylate cyclase domain-containing protein [Oligoflexus tunisiensis]
MFCRQNREGFRQYLNAFVADRLLLSPVALLVGCSLVIFSVLNGLKYGWLVGIAYVPVLVLLLLYKILFELSYAVKGKAILWADIVVAAMFVGFNFVLWEINQSGAIHKISSNGSLAILLVTSNFISVSRTLPTVYMKAAAFVIFETLCLYLVAPDLINVFKMEIIFGAAFSLATGYLKNQVLKLYYYHTETGSASLMHAHSQLQKLVFPHQLDLMKVGYNLEETMPVGSGEATVVCYDIQNSTRMPQEKLNQFLQVILERCHDVFSAGYTHNPLQVTAYKLKEMGDGFICIVGFPLPQPSHQSPYETAVNVALQCQRITEEVRQELGLTDGYCAIGIASGLVHSFYTRVGIKVYDVYGEPLVMARRYEEFRKQYRRYYPVPEGDIICVEARTLESCPPELQKKFRRLELEKHKLQVRDDATAPHVYVAVFDCDHTSMLPRIRSV